MAAVSAGLYAQKDPSYFGWVRREIEPLLPTFAERVLEIGCGAGQTLAFLRSTGRAKWVCGVELVESVARRIFGRSGNALPWLSGSPTATPRSPAGLNVIASRFAPPRLGRGSTWFQLAPPLTVFAMRKCCPTTQPMVELTK